MPVFPWIAKQLQENAQAPPAEPAHFVMPLSPEYFAGKITLVETAAQAEDMVAFVHQPPIAWIGIDIKYCYVDVGIVIDQRHTVHDPKSICPLLLALALAEPDDDRGGKLYRFVVDLRQPSLPKKFEELLRLPVPFVAHDSPAMLFSLSRLGFDEPSKLWDTQVCEKALNLGRNHKNYRLRAGADVADQARTADEIEQEDAFTYCLNSTCLRYGVSYPFGSDEERLNRALEERPDGQSFTTEQVAFAAAGAVAIAKLYPLQITKAAQCGVLQHLVEVEMPWANTNARMMWKGVRVDPDKCEKVREVCEQHLRALKPQLAALGITNFRSHEQLERFFAKEGLLDRFRDRGRVSFDKDTLEAAQHLHPAIPLIRAARRVADLQRERILAGEFVGADDRVHPQYRQLGAHTGRQSCRWPNVTGLGRIFRPLIVPDPGYGIGEVDLSQIEVGIAAAIYGDERLIKMFNEGDVYASMAREFYRYELPPDDYDLSDWEFKKKHANLRNNMKACTLGLIYGMTPVGLARQLKTPETKAKVTQTQFMGLFPTLKRALAETSNVGALRGYVSTISGLRRYRADRAKQVSTWERNWMANFPVQGSAAVVFKVAGNRLDNLYRRHDARLVIPMHDSFVFEAPTDSVEQVAWLTVDVFCATVQEFFPVLKSKAVLIVDFPHCWNKDNHANSLELWMEDPMYTF